MLILKTAGADHQPQLRLGHQPVGAPPGVPARRHGWLVSATLFALSTLDVGSSLRLAETWVYPLGAGVGNCFPVTLIALQNTSRKADMGVSSAAYTFFRGIGGSAGTALFLSLMFALAGGRVAATVASGQPAFRTALSAPAVIGNPANEEVLDAVAGKRAIDLDDTSFLLHADRRVAAPVVNGLSDAMSTVLLAGALTVLAGFLLSFLLPDGTRHRPDAQHAPPGEATAARRPTAAQGEQAASHREGRKRDGGARLPAAPFRTLRAAHPPLSGESVPRGGPGRDPAQFQEVLLCHEGAEGVPQPSGTFALDNAAEHRTEHPGVPLTEITGTPITSSGAPSRGTDSCAARRTSSRSAARTAPVGS